MSPHHALLSLVMLPSSQQGVSSVGQGLCWLCTGRMRTLWVWSGAWECPPPVHFLNFISLLVYVSPPCASLPCHASFLAVWSEFGWARVVGCACTGRMRTLWVWSGAWECPPCPLPRLYFSSRLCLPPTRVPPVSCFLCRRGWVRLGKGCAGCAAPATWGCYGFGVVHGNAPPFHFLNFISLLSYVSPPRASLPCRASFAAGGEFGWARVVLAVRAPAAWGCYGCGVVHGNATPCALPQLYFSSELCLPPTRVPPVSCFLHHRGWVRLGKGCAGCAAPAAWGRCGFGVVHGNAPPCSLPWLYFSSRLCLPPTRVPPVSCFLHRRGWVRLGKGCAGCAAPAAWGCYGFGVVHGNAPPFHFLNFISLLSYVSPPRASLPCRASFAAGGEFGWARVVLAVRAPAAWGCYGCGVVHGNATPCALRQLYFSSELCLPPTRVPPVSCFLHRRRWVRLGKGCAGCAAPAAWGCYGFRVVHGTAPSCALPKLYFSSRLCLPTMRFPPLSCFLPRSLWVRLGKGCAGCACTGRMRTLWVWSGAWECPPLFTSQASFLFWVMCPHHVLPSLVVPPSPQVVSLVGQGLCWLCGTGRMRTLWVWSGAWECPHPVHFLNFISLLVYVSPPCASLPCHASFLAARSEFSWARVVLAVHRPHEDVVGLEWCMGMPPPCSLPKLHISSRLCLPTMRFSPLSCFLPRSMEWVRLGKGCWLCVHRPHEDVVGLEWCMGMPPLSTS